MEIPKKIWEQAIALPADNKKYVLPDRYIGEHAPANRWNSETVYVFCATSLWCKVRQENGKWGRARFRPHGGERS